MPKLPLFEPNPREVALADLLGLAHDDVVAGSFEVGTIVDRKCYVTWRSRSQERVGRAVLLDERTLDALNVPYDPSWMLRP